MIPTHSYYSSSSSGPPPYPSTSSSPAPPPPHSTSIPIPSDLLPVRMDSPALGGTSARRRGGGGEDRGGWVDVDADGERDEQPDYLRDEPPSPEEGEPLYPYDDEGGTKRWASDRMGGGPKSPGIGGAAPAYGANEGGGKGKGKQWKELMDGKGKTRGYSRQKDWSELTWREWHSVLSEFYPVVIYTLLSLFTRLWRIGENNTVVWDEAHFGKFGSYYLNRTFYFDVHPPLGKMLIGLAGALSGFDGSFDYPSGQTYPEHVPYKSMRIMMSLPGVLMVPLAWQTTGELRMTRWARHAVTSMVLCDIAWTVICRFVLLDSMLLFFTFLSVYCLTKFHNQRDEPFEEDWWVWLTLTGIAIGCTASVKWVGFLVTALVGLYTIQDLWDKFGDLKMPIKTYIKHWIARALCLIIVPFSVYMLCFKIHFMVLNRSGPGDAQMSSLFQAHLRGNTFAQNPLEPAFGSAITLKNMGYGGGLLHSHVQTYPSGSQQQQVTCYHYNDQNNNWVITPLWEDPAVDPNGDLRYLKDGDVVRLVHQSTGRNLHSHPITAPVSKLNNEVAAYGNGSIGDSNDYWKVYVVDDMLRGKKNHVDRIHSLTTRMRFKHVNLNCWLRAANAVLPQWGFKQVEVSCDKSNNPKDEHTYWNVESHWNERLPSGNVKLYRSPFFRDFWHLNIAMMTSNNALIPDADKEDTLASHALDWPFLYSGMRMNGWINTISKYYLVGNPMVWWSGTVSLLAFGVTTMWYLARFQRKYNDFAPGRWDYFVYVGSLVTAGWLLHYLPFLLMGRVLYFHHYLPALYFSVLMTGFMLDHFIFTRRRLTVKFKIGVFIVAEVLVYGTWWHFRNCAWGLKGPITDHKYLRWRKSWNIY